MDGIAPFISILVFVAGLAFSESLLLTLSSRRQGGRKQAVQMRLKRHASRIQAQHEPDDESIFLAKGKRGPVLKFLVNLVPNRKPFDLWLYRAGLPMQFETFLGLTIFLTLFGAALSNVFFGSLTYSGVGALAGLLPYFNVRRKKQQRMDTFVREFPEAIELLCRSLQAGHPLQTGLRLVAEEVEDPVSSELLQVVDEIGMGLDIRVALGNLALRMNTHEMPFFVNAVLIQRETGGDLPALLSNLAQMTRERLQFKTKVKAIVSQTSSSANVLATFPLLFMGLISFAAPGYLDPLFEPGTGRIVLIAAAFLTVFGWGMCRRLTAIES